MKPTKRILKLAEKLAKQDQYSSVEYIAQTLMDLRQAIIKGRYYTQVESVARSGMSRTISIGWIKNNKMCHATDIIYKLAGCDKNRRISGCGMDMLFAAQYNLFNHLCDPKRMPYQKHMKRYNSI